MKNHLLIAAALLFASCGGQSDSDKKAADSTADAVVQTPASTAPTDTVSILIAELERLQRALQTDDKTALAGFYDFPLSEEDFSLYNGPSERLKAAIESNDRKLTAADFTKRFNDVKENQQYASLLYVLKKLKEAVLSMPITGKWCLRTAS